MRGKIYIWPLLLFWIGCVETDVVDDEVEERLEITNPITSLKINEMYGLTYRYLNHVGMQEMALVEWQSSHPEVLSINDNGQLSAIQKGSSQIKLTLKSNQQIMDVIVVEVADETVVDSSPSKHGTIESTSNYELQGDFIMNNLTEGVEIDVAANYSASQALPGLYVYLSNNPSTVDGALEIGAVTVFSGSHKYEVLESDLTVDTYRYLLYFCKPFNVKVGHGEILD